MLSSTVANSSQISSVPRLHLKPEFLFILKHTMYGIKKKNQEEDSKTS